MAGPPASEFLAGEKDPAVSEKWVKALELRKAGASYEQIARQLGYASTSGAYDAVMGALKATLSEPTAEVRKIEVERLDRLMLAFWQRAVGGDAEALTQVLKIMDRRSRLLGLDAPAKVASTNVEGTAEASSGFPPGMIDRLHTLMSLAQSRRNGVPDRGNGILDPDESG